MPQGEARRCGHCEQRPAAAASALCLHCNGVRRIRYLYRPRKGGDAEDPTIQYSRRTEAMLRQRANQRLPLFGGTQIEP